MLGPSQARVPILHGARSRSLHRPRGGTLTRDLPGTRAPDADETVALPHQEIASPTPRDAPEVSSPEGRPPEEAPSETSERLSEGVGALRDKIGEILEELDLLESRLEAAEIEHLGVLE